MSALFPYPGSALEQRFLVVPCTDGTGAVIGESHLRECQRCSAWVTNPHRHEAWHRSVDTDQTTDVTRHYTATGLPAATMVPTDTQRGRHDASTKGSSEPIPPQPVDGP